MYLSRVKIDAKNRKKISHLIDLSAYHAWVEEAFPFEFRQHERSRKLWRIDTLNGEKYLLVVSEEKPDLQLLEKYGVIGSAETKEYDSFLNSLQTGMCCRFRAVLNPVVSISDPGKKRGRVVPEVTIENQMDYLLRHSAKNGFSLTKDDFVITERSYENWHKGNERLRLSKAAYEGTLKIVDADQFRITLTHGIGKKKAYGFGMMTVIPIKE